MVFFDHWRLNSYQYRLVPSAVSVNMDFGSLSNSVPPLFPTYSIQIVYVGKKGGKSNEFKQLIEAGATIPSPSQK
jgi:hypothetical protein